MIYSNQNNISPSIFGNVGPFQNGSQYKHRIKAGLADFLLKVVDRNCPYNCVRRAAPAADFILRAAGISLAGLSLRRVLQQFHDHIKNG